MKRGRPKKNKQTNDENGFGEWGGYMEAKITKLEEQYTVNASKNPYKKTDLFSGISIYVNGLTNPSSDELKRIMMANGGVYHTYQRSNTTFIIAANLPDVKIRQLTSAKVISAEWIVDCLKENKILDYAKYLLYTECKTNQPKIAFKKLENKVVVANKEEEPAEHVEESNADNKIISFNKDIGQGQPAEHVEDSNVVDIIKGLDILNRQIRESNAIRKLTFKCDNTSSSFNENQLSKPLEQTSDKNKTNKPQARTAVDPKFLSDFYNNSRLHHIATLGASFKQHISELRENHNGLFPDRDLLPKSASSTHIPESLPAIMHIDMDCFFVSVGLRSRPHLRGQPVAVTHSKGSNAGPITKLPGVDRQKEIDMYAKRIDDKLGDNVENPNEFKSIIASNDSLSEIASCSYEARKMGVKNGMFVGAALKLCPNLKTISYDFEGYKEVAQSLYDIITKYTLDIEAVSCDEMYVDLTQIIRSVGISVIDFVTYVREEIKAKTNCPCSAGIGENRLQARMATKKAKPNGQFYLRAEDAAQYFSGIPIPELPGVGYNTTNKLNQLHWKTCEDLQNVTLAKLQLELGKKFGETLYQYCRGIDVKPLVFGQVRKSVSAEVNYGIRFTENAELETFLRQLCEEVHNRLTEIKRKGKAITLKYMIRAKDAPVETAKFMGHGVCDHITKTISLSDFTCDLESITKTIFTLKQILNVEPKELRGIGIQISKLDGVDDIGKNSNSLVKMFNKVTEKNQLKVLQGNTDVDNAVAPSVAGAKKTPGTDRILRSTHGRNSSGKSIRGSKRGGGMKRIKGYRNVSNMLGNMSAAPKTNTNYDELDMEVLAALPEDIRHEVLRDYNMNKKTKTVQKPSADTDNLLNCIDSDFLAALPSDIRKEVMQQQQEQITALQNVGNTSNSSLETSVPKKNDVSPPSKRDEKSIEMSEGNIFSRSEWRSILKSWLDSTDVPIDWDVTTVANYTKELINARLLNELYLYLRYLYRIICDKNLCNWHIAYHKIICQMQSEMMRVYGYRLAVKIEFDCKQCAILM